MVKYPEKLMARERRAWQELTADPLWYRQLGRERFNFADLRHPRIWPRVVGAAALSAANVQGERSPVKNTPKHWLYFILEELLANQEVALGDSSNSYNWDSERRPLSKVIIHHSKSPQPTRSHYHSAMELLRIYAPVYNHPSPGDRQHTLGKPIFSGHYDHTGVQGFWIYHWMVRGDGSPSRWLADDQTGWQAGNWGVNSESVAICLDADLSAAQPSESALQSAAEILATQYHMLDLGPDTVLGHNEINSRTACPGQKFLPSWKGRLLSLAGA